MYFFTSDTHFGCETILKRENRPFKNIDEFQDEVIKIWNLQAKSSDIIYHLGDFVNYNKNNRVEWKKVLALVRRINAKVILIIGNNEQRIIDECCGGDFEVFKRTCIDLGFCDVKKDEFLEFDGRQYYLNHFPRNFKDGYINLFGHTHRATGLWKPFGLNMGCDLNHFYLFSQAEIERLLQLKSRYWDDDIDNLTLGHRSSVIDNLTRYRDPILAKNILEGDFIGFYPREFFCLDNFSSFAVIYNGVKYPTVEHAYQALKFIDTAPEVAREISECFSAVEAKRIARRNKERENQDWDKIKVEVMEGLLRAKIEQNPYVKEKLLQTKDFVICEDSPMDNFWGIGENGDGQNWLGKLWMKLRDGIKQENK